MDIVNVLGLILWPLVVSLLLVAFLNNRKAGQWINLVFHLPWIVFFINTWSLSNKAIYQ